MPNTVIEHGYDVYTEDTGETICIFAIELTEAWLLAKKALNQDYYRYSAIIIARCKLESDIDSTGKPDETVDLNSYRPIFRMTNKTACLIK